MVKMRCDEREGAPLLFASQGNPLHLASWPCSLHLWLPTHAQGFSAMSAPFRNCLAGYGLWVGGDGVEEGGGQLLLVWQPTSPCKLAMLSPPLAAHMRAGSCIDQATRRNKELDARWAALSCLPRASSRAFSTILFFLFVSDSIACTPTSHHCQNRLATVIIPPGG